MQFYNRKQNPDETAEEYIQCIHSLAVKCKFNAGLTQDDMIKDRLLSGMMDNSLSSELQLDKNVSLITVTTKMRAKETIDTQMKTEAKIAALTTNKKQSTKTTTSTNSRQNTSFTNHIDNCRYCGRQYPPRKCPAYGKQCSNCSKKNHFAAVCQQRTRTANEINVEQDSIASADSINAEFYISNGDLVADCVDSTNFNTVSVDGFSIESISNLANEWLINVNDNVLKIKVDTRAQANVICEAELKKVAPNSMVRPSHVSLTAYSGHKLPVTGITELTVSYNGAIQVIPFHMSGRGGGRTDSLNTARTALNQTTRFTHRHRHGQ